MRISDWSSDVCSSDLPACGRGRYYVRIAILEDDLALASYVEKSLSSAGYACEVFADGQKLLRALHRETFDILILDWNVPGLSGYEVLEWTKNNLDSPPPPLKIGRASCRDRVCQYV